MKHRNIMAVIFFSIITLGIYDLFWLVSVKKELNAKTRVHTPTLWLLFSPIFLMLVCYIFLIISLTQVRASQNGHVAAGVSIAGFLFAVVAIFIALPITFYWFMKFSKAVNEYTQGAMSTAVTFLLLYLLRFIGMALIQDHFNDMADGNVSSAQPVLAQTAPEPIAQPVVQPVAPQTESIEPLSVVQPAVVTSFTPSDVPVQPVEQVSPQPSQPQQPPTPPAAA